MKKVVTVVAVIGLMVGIVQSSHAWWFFKASNDMSKTSNANSHNNNSVNGSTVLSDYNSHNRYDNSRRDDHSMHGSTIDNSLGKRQNSNDLSNVGNDSSTKLDSHAVTDSYKTDSHAITDSYKNNRYEWDSSSNKRVASHDVNGYARNNVMGSFDNKVGSKFENGISGSFGTLDASAHNTQTFGDVNISGQTK